MTDFRLEEQPDFKLETSEDLEHLLRSVEPSQGCFVAFQDEIPEIPENIEEDVTIVACIDAKDMGNTFYVVGWAEEKCLELARHIIESSQGQLIGFSSPEGGSEGFLN